MDNVQKGFIIVAIVAIYFGFVFAFPIFSLTMPIIIGFIWIHIRYEYRMSDGEKFGWYKHMVTFYNMLVHFRNPEKTHTSKKAKRYKEKHRK